jgi:hypothetical protein
MLRTLERRKCFRIIIPLNRLRRLGSLFYGMARPSVRRCILVDETTEDGAMKVAVLGFDLGKNVCSVVGLDVAGAVVLRR